VEAGSNTSTVTLRVVGGDEKGSLKYETVKYGREYQGTRTRERLRWEDPAACTNDRPVLSSERAPHKKQDRNCHTVINIWSWVPDGARHQDLLTDWLTVSRNVTLTWCEIMIEGVSWDGSRRWLRREDFICAVVTEGDCYKSVARMRLVKTEKTLPVLVICKVWT
jgi:hypothetical protein